MTEHRSINAVAESFFGTLRAELVDHEQYRTHDAARSSIGEYIESFYNIERRHSSLGYLNPIEFELRIRCADPVLPACRVARHDRGHDGDGSEVV